MLCALEAERILLSIDFGQVVPRRYSLGVCTRHPDLPVLLTDISWANTRFLYPVMDECPNIHVEFSTFQANYAIERLGDRYGFERLLFGTNALSKSPGAAKSFIDYADIDDEARRKVAGGNLARLLRLPKLPGAMSAPQRAATGREYRVALSPRRLRFARRNPVASFDA